MTPERQALIDANNAANDKVKADLAERRYQRGRDGVIFDDAPVIVRKRYESPAPPPTPEAGLSDIEIDAIVGFINERLDEVTTPLIERIAVLENVIETRSAAWLDRVRGRS